MKRATRKADAKGTKDKGSVTKSVSMPPEFWDRVALRLNGEEELDFSKYVRQLIRADINGSKAA